MPENTEGQAEGQHTETTPIRHPFAVGVKLRYLLTDAKIDKMESRILEMDGKLKYVLGDYIKHVVYAAGLAPNCARTVRRSYSLLGVRGT